MLNQKAIGNQLKRKEKKNVRYVEGISVGANAKKNWTNI